MSNTISRRSTRIIAKLATELTQCKRYDRDSGQLVECDPAAAWKALGLHKSARLWKGTDGKYTVHVHSSLWYDLTAPEAPVADTAPVTAPPAAPEPVAEETPAPAPEKPAHADETPPVDAPAPSPAEPITPVRLGPDENTTHSYAVRVGSLALVDAIREPMVFTSAAAPYAVHVMQMHHGRCDQSEKRRREHIENRAQWSALLERAGFTIIRSSRCGLVAQLADPGPTRAEIMTTGLPGQTVTRVTFPAHDVGGTITQITTHASMGYAVKSSTGRPVTVGNANIDQCVTALAHHWSLPSEALDIDPADDRPVRLPSRYTVPAAERPEFVVKTIGDFAVALDRLATMRRPSPREGSADLAFKCRVAAALFGDLKTALTMREPWLSDRAQVLGYLAHAHDLANQGGYAMTSPADLADWIGDFMSKATG